LTVTGQGFDIHNYSDIRLKAGGYSGFSKSSRAGAIVLAIPPHGRLGAGGDHDPATAFFLNPEPLNPAFRTLSAE